MNKWPLSVKCIVCGTHAQFKVTIETNIFRGDDEQVKSCEFHKNDINQLLKAFNHG